MLIAHDLEILVLVVEQGIRLADLDGRVRVGFAAQLLEELVDVIVVDVAVAASENAATSPPITETACNRTGATGRRSQPVAKERHQRRGQGDGERDRADRQQAAQSDESHKPAHGFLLHLRTGWVFVSDGRQHSDLPQRLA